MASPVGADMEKLTRLDDKKMAQVQPGDFIVPLDGEARQNLEANDWVPLYDETLLVTGKPFPLGIIRPKLASVPVTCMDGTEMYLRLPPDYELAVYT
ncbi:MAG: hypothetical protein KTV68_08070 [Acidimicrobiia bacterium]|nr:hypothetical protein [Acidimicrobiia bacterium]MCY4435337.1 hypothetical protein [bacterium]